MNQDLHNYVAFFKSKRYEFQAVSLWDAKQKAVAHFKPSKKDANLVAVVYADSPVSTASL